MAKRPKLCIMIFEENEIFTEIQFRYYSLQSVSGSYHISYAKSTKIAKIELSNTQLSV